MSTIMIGETEFLGPFADDRSLADEAGVLAILTEHDDEFELVSMLDADDVRHAFRNEQEKWPTERMLLVGAVFYTPALAPEDRARIRLALENSFA